MKEIDYNSCPRIWEALEKFLNGFKVDIKKEYISLKNAYMRTVAEDIYSLNQLPPYRVSKLDGIAVKSMDFTDGIPNTIDWQEGNQYVKADTGDDFPDAYDSIIAVEDIEMEDGRLKIHKDLEFKAGQNIKLPGSLMQKNELLLKKGDRITAMHLVSLAAGGINMIPVIKKPKVAFIPTGDELISAGSILTRGKNIDTNSLYVEKKLEELGAEAIIYPIIADDRENLEDMLKMAIHTSDLVIINGGSSKGSEDYNIEILKENGEVLSHFVKGGPGRPIAFALIDGKPIINMPGPAVSAIYVFHWCIGNVINKFLGRKKYQYHEVVCIVDEDFKSIKRGDMMCMMQVYRDEHGEYKCHYRHYHNDSLADLMNTSGIYISPIGEEWRRKGEKIKVSMLTLPENVI